MIDFVVGAVLGLVIILVVTGRLVPRRAVEQEIHRMHEERRYIEVPRPPRCLHEETEVVETGSEVVAKICLNPDCWEQLPADFEPKTLSEYEEHFAGLSGAPLIVSPSPPTYATPGQIHYETEELRRGVKVWNGSYWEVMATSAQHRARMEELEARAKVLTERIEQLTNSVPGRGLSLGRGIHESGNERFS